MSLHQLSPKGDVFFTPDAGSPADELEISLGNLTSNIFGIENATIKSEQTIFEQAVIQDGLVSFYIPMEIHGQLQEYPGFQFMCSSTGKLEEVPPLTPVVVFEERTAFDPRNLLNHLYQEMKARSNSGQPFDLSRYHPYLSHLLNLDLHEIEMTKEGGVDTDTLYAKLAAEYIERVVRPGRAEENTRVIDESARFDFERRSRLYSPQINGISLPAVPTPVRDPYYGHVDYHYEEED